MTEVKFIKTNKDQWQKFEAYLNGSKKLSPDELSSLYLRLIDDLSYARTNYPESNTIHYLNEIAIKAHRIIYKNKKEDKSRFASLIKKEIPLAAYTYRRFFGYAAIIFLVAIAIGWVSSMLNDNFANQILSDRYINMTNENIENDDPMAVYKDMESGAMFWMIFINNIRVAFLSFIVGILGSIPAGLVLFYNGVMVGAFIQFFVKKGLFWVAFTTIFIHGAVELTAIVIAGGCGLIIGNSYLFPGTYPRMVALRKAAKNALLIMLGLSPFVLFAAFIEGYLTRYYIELGSIGRLAIILSTFSFICWYFFIYPRKLYKNG